MRAHPLTRFKNFVVESAELLFHSGSAANSHSSLDLSLTADELESLSFLALAAAARMLEFEKPCCAGSPAGPDLEATMLELCGRTREALPEEIASLMPVPDFSHSANLYEIWRRMHGSQLDDFWRNPCSLGDLYQFFCAQARKVAVTGIQSANKQLSSATLCSFTQLYTPEWVVRFLLANTLLVNWKAQHKHVDQPLILPAPAVARTLNAEEITVLDPACGAGHFLIPALRYLVAMHKAEGHSETEAAAAVLSGGVAGADMDPVALWITALGLTVQQLKYDRQAQPVKLRLDHVQSLSTASGGASMGSLDPGWSQVPSHPLGQTYQVVVMNPPYIGRKLLGRSLKQLLKKEYPDCHQDLCAAFVQRGFELLKPGGHLGVITQSSLLSLPSYSRLRKSLLQEQTLLSVVELGSGVFPLHSGEKVNSMLMVARRGKSVEAPAKLLFLDLADSGSKEQDLAQLTADLTKGMPGNNCYFPDPGSFACNDRFAFNYRTPAVICDHSKTTSQLVSLVDIRQGLATSDNARFVRFWWEVEPEDLGTKFMPYAKGAGSERWFAPCRHVVNWENNGEAIKQAVAESYPYLNGKTEWVVKNEQFYFKPGLTFSFVNSRGLAVRMLPPGCIFDVGGSALFGNEQDLGWLLAYLNSSFVAGYAGMLNPTVNFQVGDLKRLIVPDFDANTKRRLAEISSACCRLKEGLAQWDETNPLTCPPLHLSQAPAEALWVQAHLQINSQLQELAQMEEECDQLVLAEIVRVWGLNHEQHEQIKRWAQRAASRRPPAQAAVSNLKECKAFCTYWFIQEILGARQQVLLPRDWLPAQTQQWALAAAADDAEQSFLSYLKGGFLKEHRRRFYGRPRWQITEDAGNIIIAENRGRLEAQRQDSGGMSLAQVKDLAVPGI